MRLELSSFVERDLESIGEYIAQDNPDRAATFVDELIAAIERVAHDPLIFRLRPEIGPTARMSVHGRYVILFRILEDVVRIERVIHGSRDIRELYR